MSVVCHRFGLSSTFWSIIGSMCANVNNGFVKLFTFQPIVAAFLEVLLPEDVFRLGGSCVLINRVLRADGSNDGTQWFWIETVLLIWCRLVVMLVMKLLWSARGIGLVRMMKIVGSRICINGTTYLPVCMTALSMTFLGRFGKIWE